jgi:hypothetical protein
MLSVALYTTVYLLLVFVAVDAKWGAQVERREAVKEAFRYNYAKYEEYAYPYDLLLPISKSGADNSILAG